MIMIKNKWYWGQSAYLWLFRFYDIEEEKVLVYECWDELGSKEYGNREISTYFTKISDLKTIKEATQEEVLKHYKYAFDDLDFKFDLI